ncbi:hypothetical protein LFT44_08930 [Arthrobacter sp. FW306-05-C]|nr:hypothetical protein [Arthrobacter sp. FW306-05-C]UKA68488.1 hypothetical protein LFT44_08930 [Arthrobacter sp. FW306-05-C]
MDRTSGVPDDEGQLLAKLTGRRGSTTNRARTWPGMGLPLLQALFRV